MRVKVSDLVIQFLENKGVEKTFLLSGGMMMHLLDSLSKSSKVQYICLHHEQSASMAAESFARVNNSIGVCFATSGPGATNTITGIAGAWLDSSPLLIITGQSRTSLTVRGSNFNKLRMLGNFEVDIKSISEPITKYSVFIDNPNDILYHLEKAYQIALDGRPGPVLIDIPLDVQGSIVSKAELRKFIYPAKLKFEVTSNFNVLFSELLKAQRILILGGNGVRIANQVDQFRRLLSDFNIPTVTTQMANDLIPFECINYVGKVGLRGDRAGNFAIQTADLIICIGTSLHITTTGYELEEFAPNAFKVIIDIDSSILEKNAKISNLQINCDCGTAIKLLYENLQNSKLSPDFEWIEKLGIIKSKYSVFNEKHKFDKTEINTYAIIDTLSNILNGNEIITTDAGSLYYIIGQAFKVKKNQRVIVSGALGAMGYALPAAIGASFSKPRKQVICITGDGSMQTNVQELQTVSHYNLNCKIIVINNGGYASIRNSQTSFLDGHIAASSNSTGVSFPNWEKLVESYSLKYLKIDKKENLKTALISLLASQGPVFCEIVISDIVEMMPLVTSIRLENGSFKSSTLSEMSPIIAYDNILDISKYQ
jgi:acetolactate synthase-1/2/3 large subunit